MTAALASEQIEAKLRRAAARGDFAAAQSAARDYAGALALSLSGLPRAAAAERIRQAMAAIESARRQLCAARVRLAGRMRAAERQERFQQVRGATSTWQIEA
jgi:hypothetical protein